MNEKENFTLPKKSELKNKKENKRENKLYELFQIRKASQLVN